MATHSSILAWKIPWTEEAGILQSMSRKELDMTEQLSMHACHHTTNPFLSQVPFSLPETQDQKLGMIFACSCVSLTGIH